MKLKRVSDIVFQQIDDKEDDSKPLEWRRAFNDLLYSLKNIELETQINVHNKDWDESWDELPESKREPAKLIKPKVKTSFVIKAIVDEDHFRDTIYCAEEDKANEDIFTLARPNGCTKIIIKSGSPMKVSNEFNDGVFRSCCLRANYERNEDYLLFDLTIPEEQMNTLVNKLQLDPLCNVELYVELLSFSFEVDDLFREPYHPRDIFIPEYGLAFVGGINLTSKLGSLSSNKIDEEEEDTYYNADVANELASEQILYRELLTLIATFHTPFRRIVYALSFLVFVLIASIFYFN